MLERLRALFGREEKASAAGPAIAIHTVGQPVFTPRQYDRLADEAYLKNAIGYRCIRLIAKAGSTAQVMAFRGDKEIVDHPVLALLRRPSPVCAGAALREAFVASLLISGNAYLESVGPTSRPPRELWNLRSDRMRVIPGRDAIPMAYEYEVNGQTKRWAVDPIRGRSDILHMREFHPLNDWYGLGPIEPAAHAIDIHNASGGHNLAVLQQGARPSGLLVFRPVKAQGREESAPAEVIKDAEKRLAERHGGAMNAGRPMVLGGNVDWVQMGLTPIDMDFAALKSDAARDICHAFGVPHVLIVPGQSTYNNIREAKLELYEETILPLLDAMYGEIAHWLAPKFNEGDDFRLVVDRDKLEALEPRREEKRKSVVELWDKGLLKRSEAREELQYDPIGDDVEMKPDAALITALVNAVDSDTLPTEVVFRYARATGLVAEDAGDDEIMATLRGQIEERQEREEELAEAEAERGADQQDDEAEAS